MAKKTAKKTAAKRRSAAAKKTAAKRRSAAAKKTAATKHGPNGRFAPSDQTAASYIARCLRQARERAGLTLEQMADLTGRRKQAISQIELSRNVSEHTVVAYAEALNLSMGELLQLADDEVEND
jgi:ribosome-binding protein aMBF1 (putative translation factor)